MQLIAKYTDDEIDSYYPVLAVYNSMGHRLGSFTLDTRSYDMVENALSVAKIAIDEYNVTGSMVQAMEKAYSESQKFTP